MGTQLCDIPQFSLFSLRAKSAVPFHVRQHARKSLSAPKDGHLGILRIIRKQFAFLQTDYGYVITNEKPTGIRFSSGEVYVNLEYGKERTSTCSFGLESTPDRLFWIDDLLFMYGDSRYQSPEKLVLDTENDARDWFQYLAGIFKQYGRELLSNRPGIFEKLTAAQAERTPESIRKTGVQGDLATR